jgi:hypothetical protein
MRTMFRAVILILTAVLIGLSAVPAQARFFVGFGLGDPGFYQPYPVFYRPFLPPPPPPPVYIAPRPAYYAPPPVVYRETYYRYSRRVVHHYRHVAYHRVAHRFCSCNCCR